MTSPARTPRRTDSDAEDSSRTGAPKVVRRAATAAAPGPARERFAFFRSIAGELRKVTWPTREETQRLTSLVVAVSLAVGLSLGALDYFFTNLVNALLSLGL